MLGSCYSSEFHSPGEINSLRGCKAMNNRAYSVLDVKSFDDSKRSFSGIASTPSVDRMGDSVDPMGARYALPMPLLLDHDPKRQVGHVEFASPGKNGIPFKATIATIDTPGTAKDLVDYAWDLVKARLRSFVSIGFRAEDFEVMKDGGYKFNKWEWLELSLCSIPANSDAVISQGKSLDSVFTAFKSFDTAMRAATGQAHADDPTPPGAAGRRNPVVRAEEAKFVRKTYAEQIAAFEATLALKSGRMDDIMDKAAEDGATLDAEQKEQYDDLDAEVKSISEHLVRLRSREVQNVAMARSVSDAVTPQALSEMRGAPAGESRGIRIPAQVRAVDLPKGTAFTRYVVAMGRAKGNRLEAADIAKQWDESTPEVSQLLRTPDVSAVLRSTIAAGTTTDATWAGPLVVYQNMASEFVELLRPQTILGRIQGLRRVPFNIKIPRQTAGASAGWVGELQPKPVSSLAFDQISLGFCKIASIVPVSDELLRFSSPSAEQLIRDDLVKAVAQFIDLEFIDPTKAAEAGVSPASITYGVTPVTATGTTSTALRADVITLQKAFAAAYVPLSSGVWIMSSQMALSISMMLTELGQPLYPGITMAGGTFLGLPVITSENVPSVGNSPTDGSRIILLDASQILLADDGQVTIDMSNEASLQMESSPDSPATASTVFVSLWQKNMTAFRVERYINWTTRHSNSVGYINGALYSQ